MVHPKTKYVDREVHVLMGETHQNPALHVENGVVDPGSLRHQTRLQPFQRRVRDLVPTVEKVAAAILGIEYILTVAVELNPLVGECDQVAGRNAV